MAKAALVRQPSQVIPFNFTIVRAIAAVICSSGEPKSRVKYCGKNKNATAITVTAHNIALFSDIILKRRGRGGTDPSPLETVDGAALAGRGRYVK